MFSAATKKVFLICVQSPAVDWVSYGTEPFDRKNIYLPDFFSSLLVITCESALT